MTATRPSQRKPAAFDLDDPDTVIVTPPPAPGSPATGEPPFDDSELRVPTAAEFGRGLRWGGLLLSAMLALTSLAAGVWFARFVSVTLGRDDWVGWLAMSLLALIGVAAVVIALRELSGLWRLGRVTRLRKNADSALRTADAKLAVTVTADLERLLAGRPEAAWGLARLGEHRNEVLDAADRLRLAERELVAPSDGPARQMIVQSAKRVATVTALSPIMIIAVLFVLVENLRLLRRLATLYGGRPGFLGGLRLAKLVITHIILTGGVAMTDDLLGQFLGQDIARRLSRRLGESVFNGMLTARVGTAAMDVCRPLPFVDEPKPRLRDVVAEVFRRPKAKPDDAR